MSLPDHDTSLHSRAREIFQAATELGPEEREAYVAGLCASDGVLRAEVDSLLDSFERAGGFLEGSVLDAAGAFWVGRRIGDYEILRLIGRGGVGLVFEARQDRPRRVVALKLLRPEFAGDEVRRRFDVEAELLGRLEHPGIARIYAAGTVDTELGPQSFLAMERIDGRTLLDYTVEEELSVPERVRLIQDVCEAVEHAHARGVVHRDLKPSNVLVEQAGRPKVLDFGVARATQSDLDVETSFTQAGQLIGTVSYMSPEQSRGDSARIDVRTDVYSLGVMLYQLLAGRLPLPVSELPLAEAVRTLSEDEPPSLSVVAPGIDRDLATIVGKAIEREPERRYSSAGRLGADLQRFLMNEPVHARPPSALYQLRKLAARNRRLVGVVAGVIVLLAVGVVVTTLGAWREQALRVRSEKAEVEARAAQRRSALDAYAANMAVAEASIVAADLDEARARLDTASRDLGGWERGHLERRLDRSQALIDNGSGIESMELAPDGRALVTAGTDCLVRAWDVERQELLWTHDLGDGFTARGIGVSPGGDLVAAARGSWYAGRGGFGPVTLLALADGSVVAELEGHTDVVQAFAFHPSRPLLFSASSDGTVRAWNLEALDEGRVMARHERDAQDVRVSPDGHFIASVGWGGRVIVVDVSSGETVRTVETGERLTAVGWSAGGEQLAAGTWRGNVLVIDLPSERLRFLEARHKGRVERVGFTPDGGSVLSAGEKMSLMRHELPRGARTHTYHGSRAVVTGFGFEGGGDSLLTGGLDGWIRRWSTSTQDVPRLTPHPEWVYAVSLSADSRWLVSASSAKKGVTAASAYMAIHDLESREVVREISVSGERTIWGAEFAPDSDRIVTAGTLTGASVWSAVTGELLLRLEHGDELRGAVFDPTGASVATSCRDGGVRLWDSHTGELLGEPMVWEGRMPYDVCFSPDGSRLAASYYDGAVCLWDPRTRTLEASNPAAHAGATYTLAFTRDGTRLASGGADQRIGVWEVPSLEPARPAIENPARVAALAFLPDGSRLAVGDRTGVLRLFETRSWTPVVSLRGHWGGIRSIAVDPLGRFLISGGTDGDVRVWEGRVQTSTQSRAFSR